MDYAEKPVPPADLARLQPESIVIRRIAEAAGSESGLFRANPP
jgi:hypothetical protein